MRIWRWQRGSDKAGAVAGAGEPIFFHHLAKTGGTSLIQAICSITPRDLQSARHGTLTMEFAQALVARGLRPGQFIYGHPGTSAALVLRGRTRMITLLRDPCEQVISNYYSLRNDPRLPDSRAAWRLGFRKFLLAHPYYTIFQTASLHVGIEEQPLRRTEDLIDRLPVIFDYLDAMDSVATPALAAALFRRLTNERGITDPEAYPHRFRTRLFPSRRQALREQYTELREHPDLQPLLDAEHAVYQKAMERAAACGLMPQPAPSGR